MPKAQFQGSATRRGFQPVNMQNNAPQRILQEADRVAGGMQAQAQAIIADRNNVQSAKQENYNIEMRQFARDYQIREQNIAAKARSKAANAQAKAAAQAELYQGIGQFAQGALSFAADFSKAQQEAQVQTDINEFMVNPTYRQNLLAAHDSMMLQNSAGLAQANGSAVANELSGARPVDTGRVLDGFNQFSAGQKAAIFGYKADQFGSYMQGQLASDRAFVDPQSGMQFTGMQAMSNGRLMNIAANDIMGSFMQDNGFYQMSPAFTAKGLESIRRNIKSQIGKAEKNEVELQKSNTLMQNRQTLLTGQDPTAVTSDLLASKAALLRANDYDATKTTKSVLEMVYARDARGEYIMNSRVREAVLDTPWGPNGETLGSYKQLNAEYQRQSRKDRIAAHNDDRKVAELEGEQFWENKREAFEGILGEGDSMTDIQAFNTFEEEYYDLYPELGEGDLPDSYKRLKKEVLNENKEEEASILSDAQAGFVDLTMEQARSFTDPNVREAAVELVQEDMTKQYGGNYEDLQKSLKGYAKQLTGTDVASDGMSPMGQAILPEINKDFNKYYQEELGKLGAGSTELTTSDYAAAQQKAIERLQQDVTEGLLGNGKYARKSDTKNNLYEFPGLNIAKTAAQIKQKNANTLKSYRNYGDKAFDSPSLILETSDLQQITDTFNLTGMLDVPPVVMDLSRVSGELPVDIINRQIKAREDNKFDLLKPPDEYYKLKGQNPEVIKLFHDATTTTQRYRSLSQLPDQMANKGGSDDFSLFANAVAGVESAAYGGYDAFNTGGSNGGRTAYGSGDSRKDNRFGKPISEMTLGTIRRLQANGELHAAGRYQFIGMTFKEVKDSLGLPDSTVFSPEVQDAFMIERLRQRASFGQPLEDALANEWVGLQRMRADNPAQYQQLVGAARRLLQNPNRSTTRQRVYTTGNIGPTSTGQHLDVKQVGGGRFDLTQLDDYIEVDDKDHGTVSLSQLRELTNNVGDSFDEHVARGSHGIDVGTYEGTEVYLKNGAEHVSNYETEHGTLTTIRLPNGQEYTFLHGKG